MSVSKIFMTLIIVVACVIIGALVLNTLLPNATTALVDSVENAIAGATGMSFDFNNNSQSGNTTGKMGQMEGKKTDANGGVKGKASVQNAK